MTPARAAPENIREVTEVVILHVRDVGLSEPGDLMEKCVSAG